MEDEVDEEKKQNLIIEKELKIKELSKKKYDIQKLLCSVHTLYSKRLQKLADQGYKSSVHSSDIEDGLLRAANREVEEYKEVVVSERKKKEWQSSWFRLIFRIHKENEEETDYEYYNGAQHNICKLIAIRFAFSKRFYVDVPGMHIWYLLDMVLAFQLILLTHLLVSGCNMLCLLYQNVLES